MVSNTSRALPFVSLGIGLVMAILAVMGFGKQLDTVTAFLGIILPITAGGGLVNKALDASVEKQRAI